MATGPYDLGPFQTLSAINFAQGGGDIYVQQQGIGDSIRLYVIKDDQWTTPTQSSRPAPGAVLGLSRHYAANAWYSREAVNDDIEKFDISSGVWSTLQTNPVPSAGGFNLSSDIMSDGNAWLWVTFPPSEFHVWTPGGGTSKIIDKPAAWNPLVMINHETATWDSFNERLVLISKDLPTQLTPTLHTVTTSGATQDLVRLPSTYGQNTFTVYGALAVNQSNGDIWFCAQQSVFFGDGHLYVWTLPNGGVATELLDINADLTIVHRGIFNEELNQYILTQSSSQDVWAYDIATNSVSLLGGSQSGVFGHEITDSG